MAALTSDIYVDGSGSAGGSGTKTNPYNSYAEINALGLSGDQGGHTIWTKANGATFRTDPLNLTGCSNFQMDYYGTGELATNNCAALLSGGWIQEGSYWYQSASEIGAYYGNGVELIAVSTKSALVQNNLWFDSVNSRIYIILDGTNPNDVLFEVTSLTYPSCYLFTSCSSHKVNYLKALYSYIANIKWSSTGNGSRAFNCVSDYAGGWNTTYSRDNIVMYGDSASPATDCVIADCSSTYAQNNSYEYANLNGVVAQHNHAYGSGNGHELWYQVTNGLFVANTIFYCLPRGITNATGKGIFLAPNGSGTGYDASITIEGNWIADTDASSILIQSGTGHIIRRNTIHNSGATAPFFSICVDLNVSGTAAEISENIFHVNTFKTVAYTTGSTPSGDNNIHWRYSSPGSFSAGVFGTGEYSLSNYKAALNSPTFYGFQNDSVEDPLFTDYANYDFTTQSGSPARGTGTALWTGARPIDATNNTYNDPPDKGGWQSYGETDYRALKVAMGAGL